MGRRLACAARGALPRRLTPIERVSGFRWRGVRKTGYKRGLLVGQPGEPLACQVSAGCKIEGCSIHIVRPRTILRMDEASQQRRGYCDTTLR